MLVLLCSASFLLTSLLSWAPNHHHLSLSPLFNAKIAFSSLLHFLIPPLFEEKPKETCYSNFKIFATWKLCLGVETQRPSPASFTAKKRFFHNTLRESYFSKIIHFFILLFS